MNPSAGLLLLLLLGLTQANPMEDPEVAEEEEEEDGDDGAPDITTGILTANNNTDELLVEGDLVMPMTRNAIRCWSQNCLWKKGSNGKVTIAYTISRQFGGSQISTIESGLKSFHSTSCIRFVRRSNQRDFLNIQSQSGCFSSLGRQGGGQVLSLNTRGCVYRGIVQHEVLHALGFRHEHNRGDRDKYVRINWKYIVQRSAYNFNKQNTNNLNAPYDYSSIMHYGKTAFSVDGRTPTITPIPNPNVSIGQRQGLSRLDVQKLNKLYRC